MGEHGEVRARHRGPQQCLGGAHAHATALIDLEAGAAGILTAVEVYCLDMESSELNGALPCVRSNERVGNYNGFRGAFCE